MCADEHKLGGIKCNLPLKYKVSADYYVEDEMKRKKHIETYYEKRNGMSAASLGDKSYKSSNYSADFYKTPGLIVGSSNTLFKRNMARKKQIDFNIDKNAQWPMKPHTLWEDRVRMENEATDAAQLAEAEKWEETILKEHKQKNAPPEKAAPGAAKTAAAPAAAKKK